MKKEIRFISTLLVLLFTSFWFQSLSAQTILMNEDFEDIPGSGMPAGWVLENYDGLTPESAVYYVSDAWIRREDFVFPPNSDTVIISTSWYSPPGTADDWIITPAITLSPDMELRWDALAPDPSYPDGYQVWVSTTTQNRAGCLAGTKIFETTGENSIWTHRILNLDSLGLTSGTVYFGFRNNSTAKFLLFLDDILVMEKAQFDAKLLVADSLSEYTILPVSEAAGYPLNLQGKVKNAGWDNITNVTLTAQVYDGSGALVHTASSSPAPSLAPGAVTILNAGTMLVPTSGMYDIQFSVSISEADTVTWNDTLSQSLQVDEQIYARDNGIVSGNIGIGASTGGYIGQEFDIHVPSEFVGVEMHFEDGIPGEPMAAVVWDMAGGMPNTIIASTDTITYTTTGPGDYYLPIHGGALSLAPGTYMVAAVEFDSLLTLGQTEDIFTPGTGWVNWPTSPLGGWGNVEAFGTFAAKPLMIRPRIGTDSCSMMHLNVDSIRYITCALPVGYIEVSVSGGTPPYSYIWSTGATTPAITISTGGLYSVTATDSAGLCPKVRYYYMAGPSVPSGFDLETNIIAPNFFRGFNTLVTVDSYNKGCTPVSGQIKVALDPEATFVSSVPAPDLVTADTLYYNFTGLTWSTGHLVQEITFYTPLTTALGADICLSSTITPFVGDGYPTDNVQDSVCREVVGAYDPNDKNVYPGGVCAEHFILNTTDPLTYTIRFQNTGTAEAINVHVLDSLDADLDLATFKPVSWSHPMYTEVLPGNVINFVFNNIMLPDSFTSEPLSHGYIVFEISPNAGLPDGTTITNSSAIYFDFNEPVITNTVWTTLVDTIPVCSPVFVADAHEPMRVMLYPNPASSTVNMSSTLPLGEVMVMNSIGQVVMRLHTDSKNEISLDIAALPRGMYLVKSISTDGSHTSVGRLTVE